MIPWNSPLSLINHTNRKRNASNREDFKQYGRLSLRDCGNAETSNLLQTKRNGDGLHGTHLLPIRQMDLPAVQ